MVKIGPDPLAISAGQGTSFEDMKILVHPLGRSRAIREKPALRLVVSHLTRVLSER
jgi:hypothetical protein